MSLANQAPFSSFLARSWRVTDGGDAEPRQPPSVAGPTPLSKNKSAFDLCSPVLRCVVRAVQSGLNQARTRRDFSNIAPVTERMDGCARSEA
jgi:hypothetical protein